MPTQVKKIKQLTWIAHHLVKEKKTGLISDFAKEFKLSRPTASKLIKEFISENWITISGSKSRPFYALGKNRIIWKTYPREAVDENLIWTNDWLQDLKNLKPLFWIFPRLMKSVRLFLMKCSGYFKMHTLTWNSSPSTPRTMLKR